MATTTDPTAALNQTNTQAATGTSTGTQITPADATGVAPAQNVAQPNLAGGSANNVPATNPTTGVPVWQNTSDQTVQGQMNGIIQSNSPLMQQAVTASNQGFNDRGLLNSSMAQQAGQQAAYNAALPIAQADATQAARVAGTNVTNAQTQNTANTEAQYKELTQGSASAAAIVNNAQNSINAIIANTNLDATAKQKAIDDIKTNVENAMGLVGALSGDVSLQGYIKQVTA